MCVDVTKQPPQTFQPEQDARDAVRSGAVIDVLGNTRGVDRHVMQLLGAQPVRLEWKHDLFFPLQWAVSLFRQMQFIIAPVFNTKHFFCT